MSVCPADQSPGPEDGGACFLGVSIAASHCLACQTVGRRATVTALSHAKAWRLGGPTEPSFMVYHLVHFRGQLASCIAGKMRLQGDTSLPRCHCQHPGREKTL